MAVDYKLNSLTGDVDLTNNTVTLTTTIEESSRQQVLIDLNTYQGEWDFNILAGIPWIKNENNNIQLLGKSNKQLIDARIQENVLNRENIIELISYESTLDKQTREMSVNFEYKTTSGDTVRINENLLT